MCIQLLEKYAPVVNWISVRSLLSISSIHYLTSISIYFVLSFPQAHLDTDVFVELASVMGVDGSRRKWVIKLNN